MPKPLPRKNENPISDILSPQQVRFCHLVAAGVTNAEAYRRAYHREDSPLEWTNAARLLRRPEIADYITQLRRENSEQASADRTEKLRLLEAQFRDPDLAPKDRREAIKLHNEMTGDNAPIQHEVSLSGNILQLTREANS